MKDKIKEKMEEILRKTLVFFLNTERGQALGEAIFLHMLPATMVMVPITIFTWGEPISVAFLILDILIVTLGIVGISTILEGTK